MAPRYVIVGASLAGGGLYFATTEVLTDRLRDKVVDADPPIEDVILDFEAVNFIDSQGVGELDRLAGVDGDLGITVHFARMKDDVRAVLAADGVVDRLGPDHFHVTVDGAMKAVLAARQTR